MTFDTTLVILKPCYLEPFLFSPEWCSTVIVLKFIYLFSLWSLIKHSLGNTYVMYYLLSKCFRNSLFRLELTNFQLPSAQNDVSIFKNIICFKVIYLYLSLYIVYIGYVYFIFKYWSFKFILRKKHSTLKAAGKNHVHRRFISLNKC